MLPVSRPRITWAALHEEVKLAILRYLTIEELADVMLVDRESCRLAAQVRREKLAARTGIGNPDLFLSPDTVSWALSSSRTFSLLIQLPAFIPSEVTIGRKIGSGGTNSVYAVVEHPGLVIKDAGAKSGQSREFEALARMGAIGIRTVLRDLRFSDGKIRIVMDRIDGCVDSKTIIGYQRDLTNYIDPKKDAPAPNPKYAIYITGETIQELLDAWEKMILHKTFFGDFQFLINASGQVFLNDPTQILVKESEKDIDKGTKTIIQAIIDTYEYISVARSEDLRKTWREFKQAKLALYKQWLVAFGQGFQGPFKPPDFWVLNYKFCRFEMPMISTLFITSASKSVPGFKRLSLPGGLFGYYHESCHVNPLRFGVWNE